ncbi:non-ribosomal peptide synthetase [Paenibacillus arenosi]|uniref:Amino acid adenylation domain-containing protein n=1 Tax=Paenibacillus arenosi TaxID=2774142 RepID=A0ABR9AUP2_9BACL|nr:non-ribosomal peptide synthetase [Paenibacillus arenosi]MBD8496925.1 amino acid adenylation domain-containing protein [Paenibacillus arenosi]
MKGRTHSIHKAIAANQHIVEKNYWLSQFVGEGAMDGFPSIVPLSSSPQRDLDSLQIELGAELSSKLLLLANHSDVRLHVVLVASISALLFKYTGNKEVVIGSPIYQQDVVEGGEGSYDREHENSEFINTMLPLRVQMEEGTSFKELLMQVKQTLAAAVEHQNYPIDVLFDQLHSESGESGTSLYRTVVMLENIHPKQYLGDADCKLLFRFVREEDCIRGTVEYDTGIYAQAGMERLISHFATLLEHALLHLGAGIGELSMLPEVERVQILFGFNGKQGFCPDTTMSQLFEEQVVKTPDATAVTCGEISMTYVELNERANQLAWLLKAKGIGPERLAAVLCERSIEMLVGILAVFKAGGAYVPIDVNYPMERIHTVLADSEASVVLTKADVYPHPAELCRSIIRGTSVEHVVYLDKLAEPEFGTAVLQVERLAWLLEQGQELDFDSLMQVDAVRHAVGGEQLSYKMCDARVGQLSVFLNQCLGSDVKQYAVGVLADEPMERITALSALQRLGVDYAVVKNMKEATKWIGTGKIGFMVTMSQHLDQVDRLFWEQEALHGYVLLDEYDPLDSVKQSQVQDIWEAVAEQSSEAINDYGWSSSFGGEPFRLEEMQEYIDNFQVKLAPYITKESKVFEIGCGHGLVLFQLAPCVKSYFAVDLSGTIIERNRERAMREGLHHVELKQAFAAEIGCLDVSDVDVAIVSSAVHYFPNTLYLEEVIRSAIGLLKEEGIIYLDDLLDAGRKQELVAATAAYKQANPTALVKTGWDEDLFVDEQFFVELQRSYPEIISWESSRKRGMIDNELTRFRYDVLLKIDKKQNRREEVVNSDQLLGDGKGRYTWKEVHQLAVGTGEVDTRNDTHEGIEPYTSNTSKNHSGALLVEAAARGTVTDVSTMTAMPKHNPPSINKPDDLSYVIYTSGSTGRPKGAMVEHRGMINHLYAKQNDFAVSDTSIIAQNASHCFDISVWQMFLGLVLGGSVVIYPNEVTLDADTFIHQIEQDGITILEVVPSYLSVLLEQLEPERNSLANLKLLVVTGEALKPALVDRWFTKYPGIQLANAYGPTEASDDITHYMMDRDPLLASIPVGHPIQNMTIYIVDQGGQLSPIGIKGEIWVSGIGVGRGYVNQPEKTKEAFGEDPFSIVSGIRLYKTGDIGRWMEDGSIEFLGRKDHQVKIRGHRIELGEVENRLAELPGVKESVVTVGSTIGEESFLCAYVTGAELNISEMKKQLGERLPDYMIPEYVVVLERLPLTPNGKVDRKALPEVEEATGGGSADYIAPSTDIERNLAAIWCDVLGIDQIGVNDDFFARGGHSLKVTRMVALIHKQLHSKLSYKDIFEHTTIRSLAAYIENKEQEGFISIQPAPTALHYPLSAAQNRMFIQQQIYPESTSYNISLVYLVEGTINKAKLKETFNKLMHRHESLRTRFALIAENPVQQILEQVELNINEFRCSEEQVEAIIHRFVQPFDLEQDTLFRVGLVEISNTNHLLILDMHHIIADGVSVERIASDFFALYSGTDLPRLRLQYKDYAVWQNGQERERLLQQQEHYWLDVFSKPVEPLDLPLDYSRELDVQDYAADLAIFTLNKNLTAAVREIAIRNKVSLFVLLLAIYNIILSKWCSQEDIVVGTVTSGRNHDDLEHVVGMFVNTLPQRNYPNAEQTFSRFLRDVHNNALLGLHNQEYPFDRLVTKLNIKRDLNRSPLFDTFFQIQYFEKVQKELEGLVFTPYDYKKNNTSQFELELLVEEEQEQIQFTYQYSAHLYKYETIHQMWNDYVEVIRYIVQDEQIKLGDMKVSIDSMEVHSEKESIVALNDSIQFNF